MKCLLSDSLKELWEAIEWNMACIYNAEKEKDKEYFRKENERLMGLFSEEMTNWVAVL